MNKILKSLMPLFLAFSFVLASFNFTLAQENPNRIVDNASLLTTEEEQELEEYFANIANSRSFDIVVVTILDGLSQDSLMAYADDYYDNNGYGYGENFDGCILLIDMSSRNYWISTTGYGITALTDYGIDYIGDEVASYLGDDEYFDAIKDGFASNVEWMYDSAKNGNPVDSGKDVSLQGHSVAWLFSKNILMGLIPGLIIGLVLTMKKKGEHVTLKLNPSASNYVKRGSLKLDKQRDVYLYSNIMMTRLPDDDDNDFSGSTIHTSSSGRSHGGGGGSF